METKKTPAEKAGKKKSTPIEPFASFAEPVTGKKPSARSTKRVDVPKAKTARKVSSSASKPSVTVHLDPFAEAVDKTTVSSPSGTKDVRAKKTSENRSKADVKPKAKKAAVAVVEAGEPESAELSPVARLLAEPELPELERENRARLQMQTPTRLYFYWSVKENPWALLKNVFGSDLGSYTLVHKLIDKKHGREEIQQTDVQGNYWFNVEPDSSYQAEIGFYAPNRPYFRILHSNTVETPRRGPSPRAASEAKWTVSSAKFAEVLDVAGFSRDAFDVAMAGDDQTASETASFNALNEFLGHSVSKSSGITAEDIRYALTALASGIALEELRGKISMALFEVLQANSGSLGAAGAIEALKENFDIDEGQFEEEQLGPVVYGASLVNFPRTIRTRALSPKTGPRYNPLSSHSLM